MFNLFKKKKKEISTLKSLVKVDIHSHLLPNIDDGSKSLEESIDMIRAYKELGYKKLITTPHIMADFYRNTPSTIHKALNLLQKELLKENIDIKIEVAAEYYYDDGFLENLNTKDILTFGDNYLLFETSYVEKPFGLEDIIFEIQSRGYKAVLAHPERYRYIKDFKKYHKLKELNVYFQINLNSIIGGYGNSAKEKVLYLIDKGLVDFIGSDAHHIKHLNALKEAINHPIYKTIFNKNHILNDTLL